MALVGMELPVSKDSGKPKMMTKEEYLHSADKNFLWEGVFVTFRVSVDCKLLEVHTEPNLHNMSALGLMRVVETEKKKIRALIDENKPKEASLVAAELQVKLNEALWLFCFNWPRDVKEVDLVRMPPAVDALLELGADPNWRAVNNHPFTAYWLVHEKKPHVEGLFVKYGHKYDKRVERETDYYVKHVMTRGERHDYREAIRRTEVAIAQKDGKTSHAEARMGSPDTAEMPPQGRGPKAKQTWHPHS